MALPIVKKTLTDLILKAQKADEAGLVLLRKKILTMVSMAGARYFVNSTAEVLKNSFHIEGCNDARIPLKRIFEIPLDELSDMLFRRTDNLWYGISKSRNSNHGKSPKSYREAIFLPEGHPIRILSDDHKENLGRLKELRFNLGKLNLNKETPPEKMRDILKETRGYYGELDSHIRKEEEALFPMLEEAGMQEHPQNLREEHKKFREILSKIIEILEESSANGAAQSIDEVGKSKEEFISNISNHIFRESYIFYPAALEFITEEKKWQKIGEEFSRI